MPTQGHVTVKDIAQHASVSVGTVSRVLNQRGGINTELRERVLRAAEELGYLGIAGQPVRLRITSSLKEIVFLLAENRNGSSTDIDPFWSQILHGVQQEASRYDINVRYLGIGTANSTRDALEKLEESEIRAVLLVGPSEPALIEQLYEARYQVVLVDAFSPTRPVSALVSDGYGGAYEAVSYLVSEHHRDIAFIGGPPIHGIRGSNSLYPIAQRANGYRSALLDAGIPLREELQEGCNLTPEGGYQACLRLLDAGVAFSALFCANDKTAIGAIKALRERGIRIPEDCSIIGFDDIELAEHLDPPLTTVRVAREALGATALKMLITQVGEADGIKTTNLMRVELIKRQSVRPRT
ncbi:LacI family DNA-binding transcriptional regulator [Dictyobacter aurantiacus]|uniref:LacI family transcriptional regulator n=1 Tax=Dictyobacter aurantiacus TaxID=1936993 RepID=A0A401ZRA3_9CHLR|nr:LacI family DNA-binding transcriptional regulator [Dictyobacter aurantiacus]GCE09393.1 LacI family transcriptional regulator [Dictyobacter aurantiacus]